MGLIVEASGGTLMPGLPAEGDDNSIVIATAAEVTLGMRALGISVGTYWASTYF